MSNLFVPLIVVVVILYGIYKKIDVYDVFVQGAKEGIVMVKNMFPSLLAMILAVNIFTNSGVVSVLFSFLKPILSMFDIPFDVLPVALLRPLSGSFGLALLNNIYEVYGPDSFAGVLASVIQGSSDTTIYIITLYFGTIGVKKIRYALGAGLLADLFMVIFSVAVLLLLT